MKKLLMISFTIIISISYAEEIQLVYGGMNFITEITENNINIRKAPSLKAQKNGKLQRGDKIRVTGLSRIPDKIDNHSGYWLRFCKVEENTDNKHQSLGDSY